MSKRSYGKSHIIKQGNDEILHNILKAEVQVERNFSSIAGAMVLGARMRKGDSSKSTIAAKKRRNNNYHTLAAVSLENVMMREYSPRRRFSEASWRYSEIQSWASCRTAKDAVYVAAYRTD